MLLEQMLAHQQGMLVLQVAQVFSRPSMGFQLIMPAVAVAVLMELEFPALPVLVVLVAVVTAALGLCSQQTGCQTLAVAEAATLNQVQAALQAALVLLFFDTLSALL